MKNKLFKMMCFITAAVVLLTSCSWKKENALTGIPIETEKAQAVSVYYGSICYSLFSEDKEVIEQTANLFKGFSLEEVPDGSLNADTTYQVYFSTATEQIKAINVDENNMFYLPDTGKFYSLKDGEFHLDQLKKLYLDSMHAEGLSEDQCLIK